MTQKGVSKTQKTCSTDRFTQLSLMRVIACIGIVVLHTVFAANEYFAAKVTVTENLVSRMVENNMMWAVPAFVMVTGVLQLNPGKALTLRKLYGRYVLRILIALVCCCLIFRLFDMIMDGEAFTLAGVLQAFAELITAKSWGHLWYLYLLIGLYILLPFYRMIVAHASEKELIYLCLAYFVFVSIIPMIEGFGLPIGFYISESIIYPLYLFLGYMIFHGIIRISRGAGLALLIVCTLLILGMDVLNYTSTLALPSELFGYASPFVILQTVGVFAVISKSKSADGKGARLLRTLDECSFGIYLIHMIFIRTIFRYMEWNPYEAVPFLTLAAAVVGIFLISFAITWVLKKIPGVNWVL